MAQVKGDDGGGPSRVASVVNPGAGLISAAGLGARDSSARCWSNLILVTPTVMAMAMASLISSSVVPKSLATARQ